MNNQLISTTNNSSAVLWDLDGTLIDTSQHHWLAWTAELASLGRTITRDEFTACFGQRNDTVLRLWIDPAITTEAIEQISESKEERYRQLIMAEGLQLLPGAVIWLERLQAEGRRQALATMTGRKNIESIFLVLPIQHYFAAVVTGDEVSQGKPDPEIFLQAARKVDVSPENCVVIEDAPAGIEAAHRAGMKTIGANPRINLGADWQVDSLDQLPPDIIQKLLNGKEG
jgi:beta-phosphoglucomutase